MGPPIDGGCCFRRQRGWLRYAIGSDGCDPRALTGPRDAQTPPMACNLQFAGGIPRHQDIVADAYRTDVLDRL
jgi:hypothetical protein